MKNEDTPGLAMSRSLGDGLAHSVGVSCDPGKFKLSLLFEEINIVLMILILCYFFLRVPNNS